MSRALAPARLLLAVRSSGTDERPLREALLEACAAHAAAGSAPALYVAMVPSPSPLAARGWLQAHEWCSAVGPDVASADAVAGSDVASLVRSVRELVASAPSDGALELTWLLPPHGLMPLKPGGAAGAPESDGADADPAGLAAYCAMNTAAGRGLRRSCMLVPCAESDVAAAAASAVGGVGPAGGARANAHLALEQWERLLEPCDVLVAAAQLAEHFCGEMHWSGALRLKGSLVSGLRLAPLVPSAEMSAEVPAEASAVASEAPPPGCHLSLLHAVSEDELPEHLRLPHVWRVLSAPGRGSLTAATFLKGLAERASEATSTASVDAILVRWAAEPAGAAAGAGECAAGSGLLLLYCRPRAVMAQLIASTDSLGGALRYLQLRDAHANPHASAVEWTRALPLRRAAELMAALPALEAGCSEAELRALRQMRYVGGAAVGGAGVGGAGAAGGGDERGEGRCGKIGGAPAAEAAGCASAEAQPAPKRQRSSVRQGKEVANGVPAAEPVRPPPGLESKPLPPGLEDAALLSFPPFGLTSRDVSRALRRLREGMQRGGGAALDESESLGDGDGECEGAGAGAGSTAEVREDGAEQVMPPKSREHVSLLCMLQPSRMPLPNYSCVRRRYNDPLGKGCRDGVPEERGGAEAEGAGGGKERDAALEHAARPEPLASSAAAAPSSAPYADVASSDGAEVGAQPSSSGSLRSSPLAMAAAEAAAAAHKAAKACLKGALSRLVDGVDASRGGDWSAELGTLERRVLLRMERLEKSEKERGEKEAHRSRGGASAAHAEPSGAELAARAAKLELIEVLRAGLRADAPEKKSQPAGEAGRGERRARRR